MLRTQAFATAVVQASTTYSPGKARTISTVTKKNVAKIEKLYQVFKIDRKVDGEEIRLPTKELTKLLYTTSRNLLVHVPIRRATSASSVFQTSNESLQKLGELLVGLEINKMLTITFTNFNQFNIMNKNFNYIHNLERPRVVNSNSISWLIKDILKIKKLAHLQIPANLPKEMGLTTSSNDFQKLNDWKVILSFIGYLKLLNTKKNNNEKFIDSITKTICLPLINFHLRKL